MPVPDPGPELPAPPSAPPAELAAALLAPLGLDAESAGRAGEALASGEGFPAGVIAALLADGRYDLPEELAPGARILLGQLERLPGTSAWRTELDKLTLAEHDGLRRYRLGRLYALVGEHEKAAQCYRQLLAAKAPCSLSLAGELADAASLAGRDAIALAAVDRIAEALLHQALEGGAQQDPAEEPDPIRADHLAVAELLEYARESALRAGSAPRAAALARTAVNLYERMGQRPATRRAMLGAIKALRAAGQVDMALGQAKRMRDSAQQDGDAAAEAAALAQVAEQMLSEGERDKGLALHRQAADKLEEAGELERAVTHRIATAELLAETGAMEQARKELVGLLDKAKQAKASRVVLLLLEEEASLALRDGKVGVALAAGENLRRGWEATGDPVRASAAIVILAQALLLAGDTGRSWKALAKVVHHIEDPFTAASSLRVRAELEAVEGRTDPARLLLADASRDFLRAGALPWVGECWLRRAELALDAKDPAAAQEDLEALKERGKLSPRFELRHELVQARLSEDEDEAELLLDELYERALSEGRLQDRVLAAAAKARRQLDLGEQGAALATLKPVLTELVELRNEVPEPLRKGLSHSPLGRPALRLAEELKQEED